MDTQKTQPLMQKNHQSARKEIYGRSCDVQRQIYGRCLVMRLIPIERKYLGIKPDDREANLSSFLTPDDVAEALQAIDDYMERHKFTTPDGLYSDELLDVCFDALEQQLDRELILTTRHDFLAYVQQDLFAEEAELVG